MKSRFNGFRFKTWLYFTLFALGILGLLWILQTSSMKPYYRSVKESTIQNVIQNIVEKLSVGNYDTDYFNEVARMNNLCFSIYDTRGNEIDFYDGIGMACYLNNNRLPSDFRYNAPDFISRIDQNASWTEITYLNGSEYGYDNDMVLYGSKVFAHLSGYYLVVNSYVEPVTEGVFIIQNHFVMLSIIILVLSSIVSLAISQNMSRPLVEMKKTAQKLGEGDYTVDFTPSKTAYDELDELADTLNYATEQLSKTDELRRDLIANVSHDIKTPLTMIKAYSEMIYDLSGDNKEKREEHLKVIITEANHLDRLVTDMLELSKIQSGALELVLEKTDLSALAVSIIDLFDNERELNGKELIFEGIENAFIYVDTVKIGQVIYNFINNALKFTDEGAAVIVRITDMEKVYRLEVIDRGIGIEEEELDLIWDRYHQINKHHHREKEGSGLGLAISKAILEAHNVYYGVESVLGEGSVFFFDVLKYNE